MTEEQIKQNAEEYAIKGNTRGSLSLEILYLNTRDAHIAGAHSRDEEINLLRDTLQSEQEQSQEHIIELQNELESLRKGFYERGDKLKELMLANNKLRNPWISVEKRLPKKNCVVFVSLDGTEYLSAHYRVKSKRFVTVSKDKQTLVEVRKSSATYTVCGDCIKEERLYSKGQREDITSLVTHWMQIPQIKKGGEK